MGSSIQPKQTSGTDGGFFSSIASGFGDAIGTVARDILPVWTAQQLDVQEKDQLNAPTFNGENAQRTIGQYQTTTAGANIRPAGLLFDSVNVSGAAIIGLAVAVVAGIALARM